MTDSTEAWAQKIQSGDRRATARAISAVEGGEAGSVPLLKRLFRAGRRACVIGVTGAPGSGKSTLVEKLAAAHRRAGRRTGVLAIDPTSPFTGGAILGDRIRMQNLQDDDGVYIRSMATRGCLGGLAHAAADAVIVLKAADCGVVFVETVGVGQDEVEIARLADITVLLLAPDAGDDVQAFKAGVMEIADVFVINKADRGGADRTEREIRALLSLAPERNHHPTSIVKTSAATGEGVEQLLAAIQEFRIYAEETSLAKDRERERLRLRIGQMARQRLLDRVMARPENEGLIAARVEQMLNHETDPYTVVEELLKIYPSNH